ncbi:sulfate adenylyltransferase, partial [Calditrichota bacterium]
VWQADKIIEAELIYGTTNKEHPGVDHLINRMNPWYAGGKIEGLQAPVHYDFKLLRQTPEEMRSTFKRLGWRNVVAFQTRNPIHRGHLELTLRAATSVDASLLLHPVVGMTKPGDLDHYTRVRCYKKILPFYPQHTVKLSLLPLAMRMAGPREAIWHAIIRKNFGCTHIIIGRDHAGPGKNSSGKPFYGEYDAQKLMKKHEDELGIKMVQFKTMVYLPNYDTYIPEDEIPNGAKALNISGSELRERLAKGQKIPEWFTYPQVAKELQKNNPPLHKRGFYRFLHRFIRLRKINSCASIVESVPGDRRPTGNAS